MPISKNIVHIKFGKVKISGDSANNNTGTEEVPEEDRKQENISAVEFVALKKNITF